MGQGEGRAGGMRQLQCPLTEAQPLPIPESQPPGLRRAVQRWAQARHLLSLWFGILTVTSQTTQRLGSEVCRVDSAERRGVDPSPQIRMWVLALEII